MKSEKQRRPNPLLRQQRLLRGWSLQRVVEELCKLSASDERLPGVNAAMVSNWETGTKKPSPFYQERLCKLYSMSADQLGFFHLPSTPGTNPTTDLISTSVSSTATSNSSEINTTSQDEVEFAGFAQPHEIKPYQQATRRSFFQTVGALGIGVMTVPHILLQRYPPDISEESINHLATITQHYRTIQRRGDTPIQHSLQAHLTTIQNILEATVSDRKRCELWRILSQTQLVACLNWHSMKKLELMQAKALNEAAVESAQKSGDRILAGAALGHLAHLYLREEQDTQHASQLIERSREYIPRPHVLHGWFDILTAAVAAKEGNQHICAIAVDDAMDVANHLSKASEYSDPYFTDFSLTSVLAFAGNCWLTIEKPTQAYALLTRVDMDELAINRHASALYDLSRAYFAAGQWEQGQLCAFQAIDVALATNRPYIIPRVITLAQTISARERHEPNKTALLEYAQSVLQTS